MNMERKMKLKTCVNSFMVKIPNVRKEVLNA